MKVIIYGGQSQDGIYLNELLEKKGISVLKYSRNSPILPGDVSDLKFIEESIKKNNPDYIFHFAATSSTKHETLFENHLSISTGTINILETVRKYSPHCKIFLAGSALQFENSGTAIDESAPFKASSAYSVSRINSTLLGRYYREYFNLKVYIGFLFNHDSPYRSEKHINQKIVKSVIRIAHGSNEKLIIGNVDVKKEFNYAGDIVEAIWTLVNQELYFEVVIGSGKVYTIKEWIEYCFNLCNINWLDHVTIDPSFVNSYETLQSNPAKIFELGWRPKVDFHTLAELMLRAGLK